MGANPERFSSRLWYHVHDQGGRSGFISVIYLDKLDRNGHQLPEC
ncbi:hypothetical protein [Amycolatopsis sp. NPDC051371]